MRIRSLAALRLSVSCAAATRSPRSPGAAFDHTEQEEAPSSPLEAHNGGQTAASTRDDQACLGDYDRWCRAVLPSALWAPTGIVRLKASWSGNKAFKMGFTTNGSSLRLVVSRAYGGPDPVLR